MQTNLVARPIGPSTWVALAVLAAALVVLMQFMAVLQEAVARGAQQLPQQSARPAEHETVGAVNWVVEPQAQRVSRKAAQARQLTRL